MDAQQDSPTSTTANSTTAVSNTAATHVDVAILGGGAAGLAGALQLGRMRRSVVVIDAGEPRNRTAEAMHGFPGLDGLAPGDYLVKARSDAERFGATIIADRVASTSGDKATGFRLALESGATIIARRVIVTTGITDVLPEIDGVRAQWGRGVIHCPYCHGYEVSGERITVIDTTGMGAHVALLFGQLSDRVQVVVHDGPGPNEAFVQQLATMAIPFISATVERIVTDDADSITGVQLADGTTLDTDVVVVGPTFAPNVSMLDGLPIEVAEHPSGMGSTLTVGELGETTVPGLWAAGNVVDPSQQVLHAAANGSRVGAFVNMDLLHDDIERTAASADNRSEWEARYTEKEGAIWSGRPNGSLVVEAERLAPGRVLDIGCGEGGDAVWLAQQGWSVTANDISTAAVDRGRAAADSVGVADAIEWSTDDLLQSPPPAQSFDLVTLQYPALPNALGTAAIERLFDAVVPGGRLLIVGHDMDGEAARRHLEHLGADGRAEFERRNAAFFSIAQLVGLIGDQFEIETNEVRPRPNAPEGAHHVDDIVIVARRR